jgi:hypothetical protein
MNKIKHLRVRIFVFLLHPFSNFSRKRRMHLFVKLIAPTPGMKVLDLGGQPDIWDNVEPILNITCLNLPNIANKAHKSHHNIHYIEGDACSMPNFEFGDFDIIFSNSVIEHVGDVDKQTKFANEVRRLSNTYWIQTPSKYFPIEAHCGMPFWWFYPRWLRSYFLGKWTKHFPAWTKMVATTAVISRKSLGKFFPNSKIVTEWFIFPKSLIAFSVGGQTIK